MSDGDDARAEDLHQSAQNAATVLDALDDEETYALGRELAVAAIRYADRLLAADVGLENAAASTVALVTCVLVRDLGA